MLSAPKTHCLTQAQPGSVRAISSPRLVKKVSATRLPRVRRLTRSCRAAKKDVHFTLQTPAGQQKTIQKVFVEVHAAVLLGAIAGATEAALCVLLVQLGFAMVSVSPRDEVAILFCLCRTSLQ